MSYVRQRVGRHAASLRPGIVPLRTLRATDLRPRQLLLRRLAFLNALESRLPRAGLLSRPASRTFPSPSILTYPRPPSAADATTFSSGRPVHATNYNFEHPARHRPRTHSSTASSRSSRLLWPSGLLNNDNFYNIFYGSYALRPVFSFARGAALRLPGATHSHPRC